ncbi:MAG: BCD family MFS transporter [Chloroflexi bacterium]|nr:BCD family MFS transporter [Chloroflexota bacterium]
MLLKRIQLGLIHVAVAMTLVPINSTLNRVMIFDLEISKTLVSILAVLPYLISPIQVAIGSFSDRHPILGYRRTPYILMGLVLCVLGLVISPRIAYLIHDNFALGILAGLLAFGAWGMGFNLSAVCYLSLASELSGEKERGKTIATMFFMMVIGLIATGIGLSRMLTTYSPETLSQAFNVVGASALTLGLLGLIKLEPRSTPIFAKTDSGITMDEEMRKWGDERGAAVSESYTMKQMTSAITANPVAKTFFIYLLLLLAAILGQDVLLEPFGAQAFGMSIEATTRIVSISGVFTLIAFIIAGLLEGRLPKKAVAQTGNLGALVGFLFIILSGWVHSLNVFYIGIMLLGFGTGISTIANLSLMFDLTVPGKVGLYIGAWGFSNGMSRLTGLLLAGVVADVATQVTKSALSGYLIVFGIEALMLLSAAILLTRIDVQAFRKKVEGPSFDDKVALVAE